MAAQKQDDQLERTFSSYVRIQDVVLKTYLGRWTIGRSGEWGSGISVLPGRYDDDEFSDIEIQELCQQLNSEKYKQESPTRIKTQSTEKQDPLYRIEMQNTDN